MKKVKLGLAILLVVALILLVVMAARFVLGMVVSLQVAGTDMVVRQAEEAAPWTAPTPPPYELSESAYLASEPQDDEAEPDGPPEVLVTVPVQETAEQLALEDGPGEVDG